MKRVVSSLSFVLVAAATALRAQNPLTAEVTAACKGVSANILKAAEKMPDADYAFKPAPEVRTFGQLIAHVADAQMALCGAAKGDMKRGDAASKTSKAELVAALKASGEFCDNAYSGMTDAQGAIIVDSKTGLGSKSKFGLLNFNVAHDNEMYGTMAVYLRLKGFVPPSTEAAAAAQQAK
jgi:uncharacterized damage-inducible protein DinB